CVGAVADGLAYRHHHRHRPSARQVADRGHRDAAGRCARADRAARTLTPRRRVAGDGRGRGRAGERGGLMADRTSISGPHFSGRSQALRGMLRRPPLAGSFFLGPYAEAALSGLASTVQDEIDIYIAKSGARDRTEFPLPDIPETRKPQTLSGGEQVLL